MIIQSLKKSFMISCNRFALIQRVWPLSIEKIQTSYHLQL